MTARKLHMPGVQQQERTGDGGAGAGASAGRSQEQPNGNGYAAGGQGSRWSHPGLVSSAMQPLPLASRYVGATKNYSQQEPSSSALRSSWIRRLLPASSDVGSRELGKEAAYVWRDPLPSIFGGGGHGLCRPPMLLAASPREPKDKEQDVGMEGTRMEVGGGCRETTAKVSGNGHYVQRGKAILERERRRGHGTTAVHDLDKNDSRSAHRKPNLSSHPEKFVAGGCGKQQQEGNRVVLPFVRNESHANGAPGGMMTGFGSLRVLRKPPSDFKKVLERSPKLKGPAMEERTQAEAEVPAAQPDVRRLATVATLDGSAMGAKFTAIPKSVSLSDLQKGNELCWPSRPGESAGAWGFPKAKVKGIGPDIGRPFTFQRDEEAKETSAFGGTRVDRPAAKFVPFGEDHLFHRDKSWYGKFSDNDRVERTKRGCNNLREIFVPTNPPVNLGRQEDSRMNGGHPTSSRYHSRAAADAIAQPSSGTGFPKGPESKKMKEVVGSSPARRRPKDVGPSEQHSSQLASRFSPHQFQGDTSIGKTGLPLPFSPHSIFPGEEGPCDSVEDGRNSGGRAEPSTPLLSPLFAATKPREGMDGGAVQAERLAPWTSLFSAFKGQKHPEPPNSTSSTATLPPDVHSRLQDGSPRAHHPFEGPMVSGNHEDPSRGRGRNDAFLPAYSAEGRDFQDNQPSHFASSPWPENESHNPNDEGGSGAHNSKATGSGYHSQASAALHRPIANRSACDSRGQQFNTYRYNADATKRVSETQTRNRDLYASDAADLRLSLDSPGKGARGHQLSKHENQAGGSTKPPGLLAAQSMSRGRKDDSSCSSPPSHPLGYNYCSDLCSPVLPRNSIDGRPFNKEIHLSTVQVDSEIEGTHFVKRQQGYVNTAAGFDERWGRGKRDLQALESGTDRDHRDAEAKHCTGLDAHRTQPRVSDIRGEVGSRSGRPNEAAEAGIKHGKLRMSGEAMGEADSSGPSKRSRHYPNLDSHDLASETEGSGLPSRELAKGDNAGKSSSWLRRWLPPLNANGAKFPTPFARPKDKFRDYFSTKAPGGIGSHNFVGAPGDRNMQASNSEAARGKKIEEERGSNNVGKSSKILSRRAVNGLQPFPTPSAAALALVGTAARKVGPLPQQRKGSFAMWPSVHLQTNQAPEAQISVQSSELPVYIQQ